MTPFRLWTDTQFHRLSADYRQRLLWITRTVEEHCGTNRLDAGQADAMLQLIRDVPVPVIPRYPDEVSAEDQAWYKGCMKPSWAQMRAEAEEVIHKLTK